ncbi:MAG: PGF-CTERM sorting domain-containing protein [Methanophagales archaeon]|nr:PGF-CTERM sorting domain-containing protein [Methanophagales archaeon]
MPDQYDYDSYDPNIQSRSDIKTPAFEAIFAIVGLLAVAYLLRRRR